MKKFALLAAVVGVVFLVGETSSAAEIIHGTKKKTTDVSGYTGAKTKTVLGNFYGIAGLNFAESLDRPCRLEVMGRRLASKSADTDTKLTNVDCISTKWSTKEVKLGAQHFLHGIQICTNGKKNTSKNRLKGAKLFAVKMVNGKLVPSSTKASFQRANCKKWEKKVHCPKGQVAYGVVVHREKKDIFGLALKCTSLKAQ